MDIQIILQLLLFQINDELHSGVTQVIAKLES